MITPENLKLLEEVRPLLRAWIIQREIENALGPLPGKPPSAHVGRWIKWMTENMTNDNELETLAQRIRILDAALTQLLEIVRDIIADDELEPGLMALAKKALEQGEEAQQVEA